MMQVLLMPTASEETRQEFLVGKKLWTHFGSSCEVCSIQEGRTQSLQYANGKQPVGEIRDSTLQKAVYTSQAKTGLSRLLA